VPHPKVKIADNSGNAVSVTSNRLDVNAYLSATPTIDIGDVSLLLGGTAASTNAGTMDAQTLRVTLATDDTHWGTVGTAADVDGTAHGQLRYIGNATNSNASYLNTIDTDIGLVKDVLNFAVSTTGGQYAEGDGGFLATGVRNDTLASLVSVDHDHAPFQVNAAGALYVDIADGGQLDTIIDTLETTLTAIETDQAAIEALLITIDSDTDAIKTAVQLIDNVIDGTEMQVDIVSSATLSVNSHAVTNAGTFAVQTTAANTSAFIGRLTANSGVDIGDVDVTSIAAGDNNIGNVDIASALPAGTNAIGIVGHDITGMVSDRDLDVGTSAEKIHTAADVAIKRIDIQADPANTGYIYVGDSGVAGNGSGGGIRLAAGEFYSLDIDNTGDVYVSASIADENVYYTYFT